MDNIYPAVGDSFKSGFVTLVGRPNAGKSTLINAIMGKKIAITSNTAQTTRHRFRAVLTREGFQLILVDTPGLHKPHDALGEELNTSALKALEDVDVVAFLVDASKPVGTGDEWVAAQLKRARSKKILVLSKIDLVDGEQLDRQRFAAAQLGDWDAVVELSSQTGEHVQDFVDEVVARYVMKQRGQEKYKVLDENFGTEQYAVGMRKQDTTLLEKINEAMKACNEDGTTAALNAKWFGE